MITQSVDFQRLLQCVLLGFGMVAFVAWVYLGNKGKNNPNGRGIGIRPDVEPIDDWGSGVREAQGPIPGYLKFMVIVILTWAIAMTINDTFHGFRY